MQTVTVDLASYQRETERIAKLEARIAALRAAVINITTKTEPATPAYDAARLAIKADNQAAGA